MKDGAIALKIDDLMQKIDLNLLNEEMCIKLKNQKVELSNRDKKYLLNFFTYYKSGIKYIKGNSMFCNLGTR